MMAPCLDDGLKLWGSSGRVAFRMMLLEAVMAGLAGCRTDGDEVKLYVSARIDLVLLGRASILIAATIPAMHYPVP